MNILNISKSHYNKSGCCFIKILQLTSALPGFLCHLNATWCVLAGDSWHYCMKQGKLCATVFEIVCKTLQDYRQHLYMLMGHIIGLCVSLSQVITKSGEITQNCHLMNRNCVIFKH